MPTLTGVPSGASSRPLSCVRRHPRILIGAGSQLTAGGFAAFQLCTNSALYGVAFWLPSIVSSFGLSTGPRTQLLVIPPAVVSIGASILFAWFVDTDTRIPRPVLAFTGSLALIGFYVGMIVCKSKAGLYVLIIVSRPHRLTPPPPSALTPSRLSCQPPSFRSLMVARTSGRLLDLRTLPPHACPEHPGINVRSLRPRFPEFARPSPWAVSPAAVFSRVVQLMMQLHGSVLLDQVWPAVRGLIRDLHRLRRRRGHRQQLDLVLAVRARERDAPRCPSAPRGRERWGRGCRGAQGAVMSSLRVEAGPISRLCASTEDADA